MFRRVLSFVAPSALALAALLLLADPAAAQRRGGGGFRYGASPYTGSPYIGSGNWNYDANYGMSYGNPNYYNSNYYNNGYYNNRAWTDSNYMYGDYRDSDYRYGAWETGCGPYHDGRHAHHGGMRDNVAVIELMVPPTADVTVNGERLAQNRGGRRQIVTPQIEPNQDFAYEVRMRWNEGGRTVDKTRRITFRAGDHLMLDFSRPQDAGYAYGTTERGQDADRDQNRGTRGAPAHIDIMVPPSAEIWFGNDKTTQTGSMRSFVTPALDSDRDFTYTIRAKWNEGGRTVDQTRKLTVQAGERMAMAFGSGLRGEQQRGDLREDENRRRLPDGDRDSRSDDTRERRGDTAREADNRETAAHEGTFVSFSNDKLTMKDQNGKQHAHTLTNETQIMINGKRANPQDLQKDMRIRLTTPKDDRETALRIEATSKE